MKRERSQSGVALLMVITTITVMTLVLVDFSAQSHLHLSGGVNIRDEMRANQLADTALSLSRACLDRKAWGPLGAMQGKVDQQRLCNLLLGVFVRSQVDLPIGGISVPLEGFGGIGLSVGEIEEIELEPESAFIGLAGLACTRPNMMLRENQRDAQAAQAAQAKAMNPVSCANRVATVRKLRSLLCDNRVAHIFEREQADGHRYTRAEVIGNLIDWVDPDDNRINIDPTTWQLAEGAGEGEDSYYRDGEDRYRSKDSMFDSIEELRLVRGVNDELYRFLKDKVSVHAAEKVNINNASAEVIGALLLAHTQRFQLVEMSACGEDSPNPDQGRELFQRYARIIVDARTQRQLQRLLNGNFLGRTFRSGQDFIRLAQDPLRVLTSTMLGGIGAGMIDPLQVLMTRYQMTDIQYQFIQQDVQWNQLSSSLDTKDPLYRLKVKGRFGDMVRRVHAVLKQDGDLVRTLYYRED